MGGGGGLPLENHLKGVTEIQESGFLCRLSWVGFQPEHRLW